MIEILGYETYAKLPYLKRVGAQNIPNTDKLYLGNKEYSFTAKAISKGLKNENLTFIFKCIRTTTGENNLLADSIEHLVLKYHSHNDKAYWYPTGSLPFFELIPEFKKNLLDSTDLNEEQTNAWNNLKRFVKEGESLILTDGSTLKLNHS